MTGSRSEEEKCIDLIKYYDARTLTKQLHSTVNAILFVLLIILLVFMLIIVRDMLILSILYTLLVIVTFMVKYWRTTLSETNMVRLIRTYCIEADVPEELKKIAAEIIEKEKEETKQVQGNLYNV